MASNTENLNLLMKNPSTDGADTFNVDTMLNENWRKIDANAGSVAKTLANILKPTTPPLIGLPPSTTPDGMFRALGNTGELHVWRKTVVTTEPIPEQPAGYNLGSKTNFLIGTPSRSSREPYINVMYANTVSVSNDGTVNISGDSSSISGWYPSNGDSPNYLQMRGKFIKITQFAYLDAPRTVDMDTVYYIPNDATATLPNYGSASGEFRIQMQKVTGYPYTPAIPAGTTTTYPVSTNPNAYQEGSDAKPAGYTLGEKTETWINSVKKDTDTAYGTLASSVTVSDTGQVSLVSPNVNQQLSTETSSNFADVAQDRLRGTYLLRSDGRVWYVPTDAVVHVSYYGISKYGAPYDVCFYTKMQPVTGYAAIPAGTTIEYLGKLGDKARMQVVSYVGTGIYGERNPNSLTFDFVPKAVFLSSANTYNKCFVSYGDTTGYPHDDNTNSKLVVSWDKKKMSWFNYNDSKEQFNASGYKYRVIAIG